MQETAKASVQGTIRITDANTGELLCDTTNDVLYGNISTALAHALIGSPDSFLYYLGFGNGGAYVGPAGTISYKPSIGGPGSLIKNPTANLYNTVYAKKLSNDATPSISYNSLSRAYIPAENYATNYEDIVIDVTLGYSELPTGSLPTAAIEQLVLDNSSFVGTSNTIVSPTFDPNMLVFNEIGLFVGSNDLFVGGHTQTVTDVNNFVTQLPNFSTVPGTKSKLMISHAVFHPVQKAQNRSIRITYTLRIQIGAN